MRSPVSLVTGFRFDLQGGVCYPPHRHRAVEIVLHAAGSGMLHLAGLEPVPFSPGDACICPAGQVHHQEMREPGTDLCLLLVVHAGVPLTCPQVVRGALSPTLRQEIATLSEVSPPTDPLARNEADLRAAAVLAGLLARAQRCDGDGGDTSLAQAAARLMEERHATLASLADVARALAVSPAHLRQRFTAHHGIAPLRWLTRVRVERAKDLLAHSSLSLREVAAACGFSSEQYLCAVFQRLLGKAPGAFRAAAPRPPAGR
jgi:AraC family transcriptional regulator, transcriptional activator of pobA